jgi:probable rRNA maturation factor
MPLNIEINQRVGKKVSEKWVAKIVKQTFKMVGVCEAEISIAIVGDQEMKKLNKQYRGKNNVTDVLSFTYQTQNTKDKIPLEGEIIICYPQAARQAKEDGHNVKEEIKLLLVHGLLHLCGYEHEKSERRAKEMEKIQIRIMNHEL